MAPVKLTVLGEGRESKFPERALLSICISSEGTDQAQVLAEVQSAATDAKRQVEAMIVRVAGAHDGEVDPSSPVVKFSTSSLSTGSYKVRENQKVANSLFSNTGNTASSANIETEMITMYKGSHSIEVRFRDFAKLSELTLNLSTAKHVTIDQVRWILLEETRRALLRKAIRGAYDDALQKAEAYAEGMGLKAVTPAELRDNNSRFANRFHGGLFGSNIALQQHHASAFGAASGFGGEGSGPVTLTYVPQEVTCDANCEVVFTIE